MLAALVKSPNILSEEEVPKPIIGDYDALAKIAACSFCNGTDRKLIEGKFPGVNNYPFILGHESVGRIIEVGNRVTKYKVGDWVLRPTAVYTNDFSDRVSSFWGGFAEFGVVTDFSAQNKEKSDAKPLSAFHHMQQILPRNVDPIEATIYITLKETLSWLDKADLKEGQSVLILGSGPVGLSFASCAKIMGAQPIIMAGLRDERLKASYNFGVDYTINVTKEYLPDKAKNLTDGKGVDLAIEAVGNYSLIEEATKAVSKGGKIGCYGVPPSDAENRLVLNLSDTPREWKLEFISPDETRAHNEILSLVKLGRINVNQFITHIYSLGEIKKAFQAIKNREALKVVIRME